MTQFVQEDVFHNVIMEVLPLTQKASPPVTRYRGRHRAPSLTDTVVDNSGRIAAAVVTTGVFAAVPVVTATPALAAAPADVRAAIISCESGGSATAQNSSSTASGLFQFINGTWKAYGGSTARAKDASVAEQNRVFERAFADAGTTPWNASKSCWSKKVGSAAAPKRSNGQEAPQSGTGKRRAAVVDNRAADGSGQYTCDAAHLYFEACDADNIGQVVSYPLYKGKHRAPVAVNSRGTYTCDTAHLYFEACDPDNLGETVAFPARRS